MKKRISTSPMQATERVQKECLLKMHLDLLEELNKYSGFVQFFHFRQNIKRKALPLWHICQRTGQIL